MRIIARLWNRRNPAKRDLPNIRRALLYLQTAGMRAKSLTTAIIRRTSAIFTIPAVLPTTVFAVLYAVILFTTSPFGQLPKPSESGTLLGNLLTGQAAIAALTLAVSLFVVQGVRAREDVDTWMYQEYLRRSWVVHIFWNSLLAVLITGVVLLSETLISESHPTTGLRNLAFVAAAAFSMSLVLAGALFHRAILLSHPQQWRTLRHDLNRRNVLHAIQAFLPRYRRAIASLEAPEPDMTTMFPDPGEGSADEVIQALLDDARRAMYEHRQMEFETSLASVKDLITYAMDELEKRDYRWSQPAAQPEWPLLRELARNLFPFREEIINQGGREHLFELLKFDSWLVGTGMNRNCGELFTVGLNGYRWNYQISNRTGNAEFRTIILDTIWPMASGSTVNREPERAFPFVSELGSHQERMLSDAMHANRPDDFASLDRGFTSFLRYVEWQRGRDNISTAEAVRLYETLEQDYRIMMMGLAGRAALLAQSSKIAAMSPYSASVRGNYNNPRGLADDLALALLRNTRGGHPQWSEWEWEDTRADGKVRIMFPEQYPLTFFSIRLMELVTDPVPALNLHGHARRVLDWFTNNSERLERHVETRAELTMEQRRELTTEALTAAVSNDEVEEDYRIIRRNLSGERISDFISGVYEAAFGTHPAERLFERTGTFLYLTSDSEGVPQELWTHILEPKGFLAEAPEDALIYYPPLEEYQLGHGLGDEVIHLLCEALDGAPEIRTPVDSPKELIQAIDKAKEELNPSGEVAIVLAGDWVEIEIALSGDPPSSYVPDWQIPEDAKIGEMAQYSGQPILRGPRDGERRIYIVEPRTWGCLRHAQFENHQDLRVEVKPVPVERARELLDINPSYFPDQPDRESKIRKLQTYVEIRIGARINFLVTDPSRGRRIINTPQAFTTGEDAPALRNEYR